MARKLIAPILVLCATALFAAQALAKTNTTGAGRVSASFTFSGQFPNYSDETLTISRNGQVAYSEPVSAILCGSSCAPGISGRKPVHVVRLEPSRSADVVLDLFSGGAHCCTIEQVFSYNSAPGKYVKSQRNFGDAGAKLADLAHDGRYEFLSADDRFAYAFTDYASSGLPVQIIAFAGGRFHNVTRSFPKLVAADAGRWLRSFKRMAGAHYKDSVGVIAAWAADEELLGQGSQAQTYLAAQAKAGHLNTPLSPQLPSGQKFVTKLFRLLRKWGYR